MSGWERTHRRYHLVYDVASDVAQHGAAGVDKWRRAIDAEFGGLDGFLLDVRRRWFTAVEAYSDHVAAPMAEAAKRNKLLRVVLDTFAEHPAIAGPQLAHAQSA